MIILRLFLRHKVRKLDLLIVKFRNENRRFIKFFPQFLRLMWVLSNSERFYTKRVPLRTFIQAWFLYTLTIWCIIYDFISGSFIRD
jgi:hypothetical protein